MRYAVCALAGPPLALGLGLAGLKSQAIDASGAARKLAELLHSGNSGVILIQADYYQALPAHLRTLLDRRAIPIVLPVPAPAWEAPLGEAEAYVLDLLQRAIGYRVRLR
jgi:vacuolar-type H+-ATPase subunit F/Vma7